MYYEINVSLDGPHYFATAPRSAITRDKAKELFHDFQSLFPAEKGFEVRVRQVVEVSTDMVWG